MMKKRKEKKMTDYDVAIIGAGPAGMSAGIYLARAGRKTLILEAGIPGGQVFVNHEVENYPGFVEPISGQELASFMEKQVQRLGVEIKNTSVRSIKKEGDNFLIEGFNLKVMVSSVIFATGAKPKVLGVPGEERLFGAGVSYCSTCDGMFFKGKEAFVIGGGNSALHGAEHLSRICSQVNIVHRRDEFRGDIIIVDRLKKLANVRMILSSGLEAINGEKKVESVSIKNLKTGSIKDYKTDSVFIYVGYSPQNELLKGLVDCNDYGYVLVDQDMATSLPGIFAAGDIVSKKYRQIVTAVSDGCIAALSANSRLS
jgi:thioredoxin reductase (NADPH)